MIADEINRIDRNHTTPQEKLAALIVFVGFYEAYISLKPWHDIFKKDKPK